MYIFQFYIVKTIKMRFGTRQIIKNEVVCLQERRREVVLSSMLSSPLESNAMSAYHAYAFIITGFATLTSPHTEKSTQLMSAKDQRSP